MNILHNLKALALAATGALIVGAQPVMAADIDIFTATSAGTAVAPRVILMIDNSQVSDQNFPNKLTAIRNALTALAGQGAPVEVGLALWVPSTAAAPKTGAYMRFAPRDITVAANLNAINSVITPAGIPEGGPQKDEPELFYELNQFFNGQAPYAGKPSTTNSTNPSLIPLADTPGNTNVTSAANLGLTSGHAYSWNGTQWVYSSPVTPCARNFIIYITTDNTFTPSTVRGSQCYNGVCAGSDLTGAGSATAAGAPNYWDDEWARYLYTSTNQVVTYAINAAIGATGGADATFTKIIQSMAWGGGGKYSGQITDQAAFTKTLLSYFNEILAVNSTFASANLPVNTTNRTQEKNQVFIPVFRPDANGLPLWMGNMKEYQLIASGGQIVLGDSLAQAAVNPVTGFLTDCAVSFWTSTPSSPLNVWYDYWFNVNEIPVPKANCATSSSRPFADSPDGPTVEKGGVAEVIRNGNNPPTTSNSPTMTFNRTIMTATLASNMLTSFDTANTTLTTALGSSSTSIINFTRGLDVNAEYLGRTASATATLTRPSLHGDVVHSRPLPIDYGVGTGVVVFYGANDAMFRAADAATGKELWAFVAPEHWSKLARLQANSPLIQYPGLAPGTGTDKDYFFDGSIGLYKNADNSKVWIYPSMRRGGRMIYAFDVTTPSSPSILWKAGCPNLGDDSGCTSGLLGMGQTWSAPAVAASIQGYSSPVVIVGGGYDGCEDANTSAPSCSSPKGAGIYVFDAQTGALVKSFATTRSVPADVVLWSSKTQGLVDHAYAVDTGGNIYRIDFGNVGDVNTNNWAIKRVAFTNGSGRKFFYPPTLLPATGGSIYLALGSGDREHPLQSQYPYTTPVTNRFYVYNDRLGAGAAADNLDDTTTTMRDVTACANAICDAANTVLPTSTFKGWFMNQNRVGEQTVTSAVIVAGMVTFSTNRPIPAAAGTCSTALGEARGYFVNVLNGSGAIGVSGISGGTRSAIFVNGGLPPSPVLARVPVGGVPQTVVIGAIQRGGGASSTIGAQQVNPVILPKRKSIYWKSSGEN